MKNRVVTVADPSIEVVTFTHPDGSMEILMKRWAGPPTEVRIPTPPLGCRFEQIRRADGSLDIFITDGEDD